MADHMQSIAQNLDQKSLDQETLLHRMTNQIRQSLELSEILKVTVEEIRSFLGTDRVMIYRFDQDNSGEVIAESINGNRLPSLIGLHFPADDIPLSYRELLLNARIRSIVDVTRGMIGVSPLDCSQTGKSLETREITYRAVDPCHIQYLRTMGVSSSLVVPILERNVREETATNRLWGLLVSHHSESHYVLEQDLQVVQLIADQVSIAIAQSNLLALERERAQREATINQVATLLHELPTIHLQSAFSETVTLLNGAGGRLYISPSADQGREVYYYGIQPNITEELQGCLLEEHPMWCKHFDITVQNSCRVNGIWAMTDIYQEAQLGKLSFSFFNTKIRGMLVIPLQYRQQFFGYLTIFRREIDTEKLWAGNFDLDQRQGRPRQSFEVWRQLKKGQADRWTSADIELAKALGNHFSMAIQQHILYHQVQGLNANLELQVQKRTMELQQSLEFAKVLGRVTEQMRSTLDLKTTLQIIVREVQSLLNNDRVLIYQLAPDRSGEVIVEAVNGTWASALGIKASGECFPAQYNNFYLERKVCAVNNTAEVEISPCYREFLETLQVKAKLIVPIGIGSQLWGLLIAHECGYPRIWQNKELELLKQLADQAAIAIQQAELYQQSCNTALIAEDKARQLAQTLDDLRQTQAQLIQTEKMSGLGQLVAGVAHEINNPVNFIYGNIAHASNYIEDLLGLIELYQQHYPNPDSDISDLCDAIDLQFLIEDLPNILSSMKIGADRIRQLVLSLRNFSRLDQAEMKPVDIHEGIDSTLLILQHRLKNKAGTFPIQIIKEYGDLPLVECYAGQLNQVFMNVIGNGIDALEERDAQRSLEEIKAHPSKITIRSAVVMGNNGSGGRVVIRIADNGKGMPESVQAKIFDPFFTTKPVGKGTGLGLSISYQIVVEKHGGVFKCTSQPDQGTEFLIEIPIRPAQNVSTANFVAIPVSHSVIAS